MDGERGSGATKRAPAADRAGAPRGGLRRWIRRLALAAIEPELRALEGRVAGLVAEVARLADRAAAVERGLGSLVGRTDESARLSGSRFERLEERLTSVEGASGPGPEVEDAVAALQGELHELRDRRFPELEERFDRLADAGVGALQREMEALRDERLPGVERRLDAVTGAGLVALQAEIETLRDDRIPRLEAAADGAHVAIDAVQNELAEARDIRLARVEADLSQVQAAVVAVQEDLVGVRDGRLPELARDLEAVQAGQEGVQRLAEEVRDRRLPALAERVDALLATLHEELTATAGLVDRILAAEPLHVQADPALEVPLPEAFRNASASFIDTFRGASDEISARVSEYLPRLRGAEPVLDLGCGRGELLGALAAAGVAARGVDDDPAMVEACRRSGLSVSQADVLEFVRGSEPETYGAITAIHVFEHLPAAVWMTVAESAARALKPGGVLIVECPNPEALRVGGALFWIDPTHRAPLHPDSLTFVLRAVGLEIEDVRYRRPFPPDQKLARDGQTGEVRELAERLDVWLSGARDFAVVARKP